MFAKRKCQFNMKTTLFWRLSLALMAVSACMGAVTPDLVTIRLTSAGNNIMGGVYVNPYTALIDGVSTLVICDDFVDNAYVNEVWTAQKFSMTDDLSSTRMAENSSLTGSSLTDAYKAAAYLATRLLSETDKTERGKISFALWAAFDSDSWTSGALATLTSAQRAGAQNYLAEARAATEGLSAASFYGVSIYSPVSVIGCPDAAHPCPSTPPQEMLVVKAAEPFTVLTLALELGGVVGIYAFARRRKRSLA